MAVMESQNSGIMMALCVNYISTKNVAIANALKLEAVRATPALSLFNYDARPSLKSLNLSIAVL